MGEQKAQTTTATAPSANPSSNTPKQYSNFRNLFGNISEPPPNVNNNNMNSNFNPLDNQNGIYPPQSNNIMNPSSSSSSPSSMLAPMNNIPNSIQPTPVNIPSANNFPPANSNQNLFPTNFPSKLLQIQN